MGKNLTAGRLTLLSIIITTTLALAGLRAGACELSPSKNRRPDWSALEFLAKASLNQNIVALDSGSYLVAGKRQFMSLWTRDFCFASRGLLAMGDFALVRRQIEVLLKNRRERDGLVPRVLDSYAPRFRVLGAILKRFVPIPREIPLVDPLLPEYFDEHGSSAIDSNALLLIAASDYAAATGDAGWLQSHVADLAKVYHYYDSKLDPRDGLVVQPAFSDWQDSVNRTGKTFYTNLMYLLATERFARFPELGITQEKIAGLRASIERTFFDPASGLYKSVDAPGSPYLSLDGNLLAIDEGYFGTDDSRARALYEALKRSPLWHGEGGGPGFATWPDYPASWKSWEVRFARMSHYHDEIYWTWLMALSAKTAWKMGDRADATRILDRLSDATVRDGGVGEVLEPSPELPLYRSWIYSSEIPFSWGAAFVIDAIGAIRSGAQF